jgi:hypothetical protein
MKFTKTMMDFADLRYLWCGGPGSFGSPNSSPFKWTGGFNIHDCHVWWTTEICLYVLYPYLSTAWYNGILTLNELYTKMCLYSVDVEDFKKCRPKIVRGLVYLENIMPAISIGILFHEMLHIYDFCIFAGPAFTYWMYIFERLVSFMSRQIHDRARPERNLANNLAKRIGLTNVLRTVGSGLHWSSQSTFKGVKKLIQQLGLRRGDAKKVYAEGEYELGKNIRGAKISWDVFTSDVNASDFSEVTTPYQEKINDKSIKIRHLGVKGPEGFRIKIGNCTRACERTEPAIGNRVFYRRRSGFRLRGTEYTVGKLQEFYSIENELFASVDIWTYYEHAKSKLNLIDFSAVEHRVINAKSIGGVMVFAPWTMEEAGRLEEIDKSKQCVLRVRDRDHF